MREKKNLTKLWLKFLLNSTPAKIFKEKKNYFKNEDSLIFLKRYQAKN